MTEREHEEKLLTYLAYLQEKIKEKDWHGVIDMALELFELEIRKECERVNKNG